jgi:hypothetical protein
MPKSLINHTEKLNQWENIMSTMFIDNDQSTTFISEEKSTFFSEEKSTGMYFFT